MQTIVPKLGIQYVDIEIDCNTETRKHAKKSDKTNKISKRLQLYGERLKELEFTTLLDRKNKEIIPLKLSKGFMEFPIKCTN